MENRLQSWSPYLGALGVALLVAVFLLWILFQVPAAVIMGVGAVAILLIAVFILTRPRESLRASLTGRGTLQGSNALVLTLAFIGIVMLVNFIVVRQVPWKYDFTANKSRTLSDQTVKILQQLKEPISVVGFFTPNNIQSEREATDLIKDYQAVSNKISYELVDPQVNPAIAVALNVTQDGTVVFQQGKQTEKVNTIDENSFSNAVLKVSQGRQPAVYFTSGHGEIDPTDSSASGLSAVTGYLQQQLNYQVTKLNLTASTVPTDTSAIVIARPAKPFAADEEQRLKQYLQSGGRILLMADAQTDPGLKDLLQSWGVQLNNDWILDPAANHNYGTPSGLAFLDFPSHPVTENLATYGVAMNKARSIKTISGTDKTPTALFTTSDQACGKTDFAALQSQQQPQCDPAKDEKGPFEIGYAIEGTAQNGGKVPRLVVVGSSSFATNDLVSRAQGNAILLENTVNWLAGQEQLISIPPKDTATRQLNVTTSQQGLFIMISNVLLVPGIILIIGLLIWWRRR